jgi:hypothetical protein
MYVYMCVCVCVCVCMYACMHAQQNPTTGLYLRPLDITILNTQLQIYLTVPPQFENWLK